LVEKLGTNATPSVLARILTQNQQALAAQRIQYSSTRTGQRREITLLYDGNDSNDGKFDTVEDSSPPLALCGLVREKGFPRELCKSPNRNARFTFVVEQVKVRVSQVPLAVRIVRQRRSKTPVVWAFLEASSK